MQLEFESGRIVEDAKEDDILGGVEWEDFSILSADDLTYMQCGRHDDEPGEYSLEYQDGSLDAHYCAADEPIALDRVIAAFLKYLRGDESWRMDFRWEKLDLS